MKWKGKGDLLRASVLGQTVPLRLMSWSDKDRPRILMEWYPDHTNTQIKLARDTFFSWGHSDFRSRCALSLSIIGNHSFVAAHLVKSGAKCEFSCGQSLESTCYCRFGHSTILTQVCDGGCSTSIFESAYQLKELGPIDHVDRIGNFPLHITALKGNSRLTQTLVECGEDPNIRNIYNESPLLLAVLKGHSNVVEVLLEAGVCLTFRYLVEYEGILNQLHGLGKGCDWDILSIAISIGNHAIVSMLLSAGMSAEGPFYAGYYSPLEVALVTSSELKIVQEIVKGTKITIRDLRNAVKFNQRNVVVFLLNAASPSFKKSEVRKLVEEFKNGREKIEMSSNNPSTVSREALSFLEQYCNENIA